MKNAKLYDANDFDEPLVRARIEKYCSRLKIAIPERITDNWLQKSKWLFNLIRQDSSGVLHTTNAGLLFGSDLSTISCQNNYSIYRSD
ncbi:MAG: hypothetical protein R2822_08680 [Spirosomataceae bacterium]